MSNTSPPKFLKYWHVFRDRLYLRLTRGHETYGDASFDKDPLELVEEIQQELEDVCGWGLIEWVRLEQMKTKIKVIQEKFRKMNGIR